MRSDFPFVTELDQQIRRLTSVDKPAEVFKILIEVGALAGPRSAMFLIRRGEIQGWGSIGYPADVARTLRGYSTRAAGGWLERLISSEEPILFRASGETDPDFGQFRAAETAGCILRIKDKPIGLILIEHNANESNWFPQVLALAVTVAQLRLELDVAQRRAEALSAATRTTDAPPPSARIAPTTVVEEATLPATRTEFSLDSSAEVALAPAPESSRTAPEDAKKFEAARRYARLVATDIRLYNEEAVTLGRRNGDLTARIAEHLGRGKETFMKRHGNLGPAGLEILHDAYVQVLAAGDLALIPRTALE